VLHLLGAGDLADGRLSVARVILISLAHQGTQGPGDRTLSRSEHGTARMAGTVIDAAKSGRLIARQVSVAKRAE
jgi:hypothetical protein